MLLTSHYMEDIERLCQRILIIRDGEIVYDGSLSRVVESYAEHKVVTAHLRRTGMPAELPRELRALGEVVESTDVTLRLRVPRADVARAAAKLLAELPVLDIAIEEPEIGTIIERIMQDRGGTP